MTTSFHTRWRRLARAARNAGDAPLPPAAPFLAARALAARREPGRDGGPAWRLASTVSLLVLLNVAALPFAVGAVEAVRDTRVSLRDVPRPPALPPLRLPSPPRVPAPPALPSYGDIARAVSFPETAP